MEKKIVIIDSEFEKIIYYIPECISVDINDNLLQIYFNNLAKKTSIRLLRKNNLDSIMSKSITKWEEKKISVLFDEYNEKVSIFDYEDGLKKVQELLVRCVQNLYSKANFI